jgi:hypothetical protein
MTVGKIGARNSPTGIEISTEEMSAVLGADEMAEYFDLMDQAKKEEKEKKEEEK